MEIFAPIEKKISLDGIHFFQENFPTVCARSNKVLLSVFFFFYFCFYRWNFFDFKISEKKSFDRFKNHRNFRTFSIAFSNKRVFPQSNAFIN